MLNVTVYNSDIYDYQTNVQSPELGVNRGYIANADHVRVSGVEVDAYIRVAKKFSFNGAVAYTNGKYVTFKNATFPMEETGRTVDGVQVAFCPCLVDVDRFSGLNVHQFLLLLL